MNGQRLVPASETRIERKVSNSRFIASAAPTFTVEEAKTFIGRIRTEFGDASHNVPSYIIGHGASTVAHCHDDGEPSGTAGRPVLSVLRGSGLGDVTVVITRYFGGAKLGTGGLVKAYSDAAKELLAVLPRATKVATLSALVVAPYSLVERLRALASVHGGLALQEEFAAEVTFVIRFPVERFPAFHEALRELSHGQVQAVVVEANEVTLLPVP